MGESLGKLMVGAGLALALSGALVWGASRWWPGLRLGRLPGDVVVERPGFVFVFPVVTSLALSALLTLVLWLIAGGRR